MLRGFMHALAISHEDIALCVRVSREHRDGIASGMYEVVETRLVAKFYVAIRIGFVLGFCVGAAILLIR